MFFFSDHRCNFPKGKIQLQTACPFYEPGNEVQGVIYLEIMEPVYAHHIEMEVKGGEKCSFTRFWTESERHGDETRFVERHEKLKHSKKFLEFKPSVFDIQGSYGGVLQPGIYQVDFQMKLPDHIPSSLHFKDHHSREKPKAKVKYYVKVVLKTHDKHDEMKYKQVLIIREKPVAFRTGDAQAETSHLKTWCCIDQGTSTMSSVFEKNQYLPTEVAKGFVRINNEHCQLNAHRVSFYVEQRLTVHIGHHSHTHVARLVNNTMEGPHAGAAHWEQEMMLNLGAIKYEVVKEKKKKGVMKAVSPEDAFMMAGVQPATHGKKVTNEYFLCVLVEYAGCVCCVNLPDSRMPLTIIPIVNPACFGFQPPNGWAPMPLGSTHITLTHHHD